jgi:hypothetical protein
MAHADDATKAWVKAIPKTNADGNVIEWELHYKYTLAVSSGKGNVIVSIDESNNITYNDDYIHTFNKLITIETPSKAPASYTKAELLTIADKPHWDDMFNRKYTGHIATPVVETTDTSFDVSTLNDS